MLHHNNIDCDKTDHIGMLNDIVDMQNKESRLSRTLERKNAYGNKRIHNNIKELDSIADNRMTTTKNINKASRFARKYNSFKTAELNDKRKLERVMKRDLNNKRELHNTLVANKASKMRTVEINNYYTSKYNAQADIMKIIIIICLPLLIITILSKKSLISQSVSEVLTGIVVFVGVIVVVRKIYDLSRRNNMNFDEYEWGDVKHDTTDTNDSTANISENDSGSLLKDTLMSGGCIGEKCCKDDMYYDEIEGYCVNGIKPGAEGFSPF